MARSNNGVGSEDLFDRLIEDGGDTKGERQGCKDDRLHGFRLPTSLGQAGDALPRVIDPGAERGLAVLPEIDDPLVAFDRLLGPLELLVGFSRAVVGGRHEGLVVVRRLVYSDMKEGNLPATAEHRFK